MSRQIRPQNTVPIFDSTARTNGVIPCCKQVSRDGLPGRIKTLHYLLVGWTKPGSTEPGPCHQCHRLRAQGVTCLILFGIKLASKEQGFWQGQTDVFREHLYVPLHVFAGHESQLIQQSHNRDDLVIPLDTGETLSRIVCKSGNNDFKQRVQFLAEIPNSIGDRADLSQLELLLRDRQFGTLSSERLPTRFGFCPFLELFQAMLFSFSHTVQTSLNLCCTMEEMPHISLMTPVPLGLAEGISDRTTAVAHCARSVDPLFLEVPQNQGPALSIDFHRRYRGPDLPTVHIYHIQIRFSTLATVLLIQSQDTLRIGFLLVHPLLSTFTCFFDNASNRPQADLDPMIVSQIGLNPSITGMRVQKQVQNKDRKQDIFLLNWHWTSQRAFHCLYCLFFPTVQRLTRNVVFSTHLRDQPMLGCRYDWDNHLKALLSSATMVHVSSLRMVKAFCLLPPYFSGILFVNFAVNCHIGSRSL